MIEYILKTIFCIFQRKEVLLVIYYGNKQGKDIDIFIIITGNLEYKRIHQDKFDITCVGEKHLKNMIEHYDPLLTEPVLTGEVIYGNINQIQKDLNKIYYYKNIIDYLINKSLLYLQWANIHFYNGNLIYVCDCLRFSLSFYYFAIYYRKENTIITFSELINKLENKQRLIIERVTKMAKNRIKLNHENVDHILIETCKILTNN